MPFSYDVTTDIGKIRLIITDSDEDNEIFSDEEIQAFLELQNDTIFLAAAMALDTIASSQSLVLKVITNLGLSTNGPQVAADLRKHAADLRALNKAAEEDEGDSEFDIAEMVIGTFGYRERLYNQALRTEV